MIRQWLYAIAVAILGVFGVTSVYFKKKYDKAKEDRDTLKATVHAERERKKIEKEKKVELSRRESEIREKGKKENEDFDGFDNLTDPNDWD